MSQKQKRNLLKMSEKIAIIEAREKNNTLLRELSAKYNCSQFQISKILKNKELIKELWEKHGETYKRIRKSEKNCDINRIVHLWYQDARSQNLTISDSILKSCAKDVAKYLNRTTFKPTSRWLNRFQRQFSIRTEKQKNTQNLPQEIVFNNQNSNWITELDSKHKNDQNSEEIHEELDIKYEPEGLMVGLDTIHTDNQSQIIPLAKEENQEPVKTEEMLWFADRNPGDYIFNERNADIDTGLNTPNYTSLESKSNADYPDYYNFETMSVDFNLYGNVPDTFQEQVEQSSASENNINNRNSFTQPTNTINSYPELLKHIHSVEDFAISQNDITLLKLSCVTRFIVEQKIKQDSNC